MIDRAMARMRSAMIDRAYVQRMARYNRWQNENLYGVADRLSEAERRRERGAFFGSIHKTLSHLLWGDQIWMGRFTDLPRPTAASRDRSRSIRTGELKSRARGLRPHDDRLGRTVDPAWLAADQTYYSCAHQRDMTQAALGSGHAYVQSSDPSSRPGPLHADAGRRQTARYRSAFHAGLSDDD